MSDPDHEPKRARRKGRWIPIAFAAVAGVALGTGAYALKSRGGAREPAVASQPAIGGDFQLVDQDGRAADEALLRGKWSAVFFGYTGCPDFCPATLQSLQAASGRLGDHQVQVVLISVDPERDTPAVLKSYLEGYEFPGGVRGLTGTPEQVDAAVKSWRVYRRKVPNAGPHAQHGGYMMDHSTVVYLTNPQGEFVKVLSHDLPPEETARQIRAAMGA